MPVGGTFCGRANGNVRDERGSLLAVMAILVVVAMLSVALVYRVTGDFHNVNFQTNIERARSLAQSGVADALFQIDQRDPNPGNFCNAPQPPATSPCTMTSVPSAPGIESSNSAKVVYTAKYYANGVPPSPYTCQDKNPCYVVKSQGRFRGVTYAVSAVVTDNPVIDSALVGSSVTLNGNVTLQSVNVTGPDGNVVAGETANIAVASGGNLRCNGGGFTNQVSPLTFTQYAASSVTGCSPVTQSSVNYVPLQLSLTCPTAPNTPPQPCMLGSAQPCNDMVASGGSWSGDSASGYTIGTSTGTVTLEPGIYVCNGGLALQGTVNVDYTSPTNGGRVEVFVVGPQGSPGSSSPITLGGTINACTPTASATSGPCGNYDVGNPADLQIYGLGTDNIDITNLSSINALLWAPGMSLYASGQSSPLDWTGALVIGGMRTNGSPVSLSINYDTRLETQYQVVAWQVSSYLQTTPNFTIP
jgi:hypothetical protein